MLGVIFAPRNIELSSIYLFVAPVTIKLLLCALQRQVNIEIMRLHTCDGRHGHTVFVIIQEIRLIFVPHLKHHGRTIHPPGGTKLHEF